MIQEYIEDKVSEIITSLDKLNIPISDFTIENCINDILVDNPSINGKKAQSIAKKIMKGINKLSDVHPIIRSMSIKVHDSWLEFLSDNIDTINHKVNQIGDDVYFPSAYDVWNAFTIDIKDIKVVIIAQEPNYIQGSSHGYALSCRYPNTPNSALQIVYKELERSYDDFRYHHGDLTSWHDQGVFLLNRFLTVQENKPRSHTFWGTFTINIISYISSIKNNIVFMLWGKEAKLIADKIDDRKNYILMAVHPLSTYGSFIGCNHFKLANEYLVSKNKNPINWHSVNGIPAYVIAEKLNNIK